MQGWGFKSGSRLLSLCFTTKPATRNLPQVRTFVRVPQKRLHPRSSKLGGHTTHVDWGACEDGGTGATIAGVETTEPSNYPSITAWWSPCCSQEPTSIFYLLLSHWPLPACLWPIDSERQRHNMWSWGIGRNNKKQHFFVNCKHLIISKMMNYWFG